MQQRYLKIWSGITAFLLGSVGLFLFLGGLDLLFLGGSWFYAVAGVLLLGAAITGFRNPSLATRLYAGLLVLATFWAILEVGFNIWGLEVRLLTLSGLGAWLLLPNVWRTQDRWLADKKELLAALAISLVVMFGSCFASYSINGTVPAQRMAASIPDDTQNTIPAGDWPFYVARHRGTDIAP